MTIRIYIVEDHPVMRETLQEYLVLDPEFEICGTAGSAEAACEALEAAAPDVVIVDLSLPGRSGLQLVEEIRDRWQIPCVILSGHGERSYVSRALACGARGYVLKGTPQDLAPAIRKAIEGEIHLSPSLRQNVAYEIDVPGA